MYNQDRQTADGRKNECSRSGPDGRRWRWRRAGLAAVQRPRIPGRVTSIINAVSRSHSPCGWWWDWCVLRDEVLVFIENLPGVTELDFEERHGVTMEDVKAWESSNPPCVPRSSVVGHRHCRRSSSHAAHALLTRSDRNGEVSPRHSGWTCAYVAFGSRAASADRPRMMDRRRGAGRRSQVSAPGRARGVHVHVRRAALLVARLDAAARLGARRLDAAQPPPRHLALADRLAEVRSERRERHEMEGDRVVARRRGRRGAHLSAARPPLSAARGAPPPHPGLQPRPNARG